MRRPAVTVLLALAVATGCSGGPDATSRSIAATSPTAARDEALPTSSPAPPEAGSGEPAGAVTPEGFERVRATVTDADGSVCELCVWLADSGDRRSRGLMAVTDLGAADGMAFVYPRPHRGNFWMKDTLLPLSIAFFAPDGGYLDAFDMEPCTADPCALYPTPDDFLIAIETTRGDLGRLGIGPGSVLALTDLPCP